MNRTVGVIGLIAIAVFIAVIGYFIVKQTPSVISTPVVTPTITTNTTVTVTPTPQATSKGVADLRQGGSSYSDKQGVFVFLYPNDYTLDEQNNGKQVRIYKQGPTQKGQTEMYDGVIIVFETIDLKNATLEEWVDASIQSSTADSSFEVTSPKRSTTLNGYPGFTYAIRGLGESTYLVVQKDTSSRYAVSITSLVADPANQGFQSQMNDILSTVELLK